MNADEAAADAVDGDRLLDGEDPSSTHAEDAVHWRSVYRELLDYKTEMLARTRQRLGEMEPRAAEEIERTDLTVLVAEAERFQRRLAFWERRAGDGLATDGRSSPA